MLAGVLRGLVARWWLILGLALLGGLVAHINVRNTNETIRPVFRASAEVTIPGAESDSRLREEDLAAEQAAALELASSANEVALSREGNNLAADPSAGTLTFVAVRRTEAEAIAAAEEMRAAYVAADERFSVAEQLSRNVEEAALLEQRLEDLMGPAPVVTTPSPEDEAEDEVTKILLDARASAVQSEINSITAQLLEETDDDEVAALESRLSELQTILTDVLVELSTFEEDQDDVSDQSQDDQSQDDVSELSLVDQWTLEAIENRLEELEASSGPIILGDIRGEGVELPAVTVADETPAELPYVVWVSAGLAAGALLAAAIVMIRDRSRRIIWNARDVGGVPVLAEGPAEPEAYPGFAPSLRLRRRKAIRAIRSAILSATSGVSGGSVVGFSAPPSTTSRNLTNLAYDVGASMAWIGRTVLIIDVGFATFDPENSATTGVSEMYQLVGQPIDDEHATEARVMKVLNSASTLLPGLDALFVDPKRVDAMDLLDGKPFKRLLERSVDVYDIVFLVTPTSDVASPARVASTVLHNVIVATRGKTSLDAIEAEMVLGTQSQDRLRGVVILHPGIRLFHRLRTWLGDKVRAIVTTIVTRVRESVSALSDLHSPAPGEDAPDTGSGAEKASGQLLKTLGPEPLLRLALADIEGIQGAFIYGSWADPAKSSPADIDLLVVGDPDVGEVYDAVSVIEAEVGRPVNVTVRSPTEWADADGAFETVVKSGPRIDLL